MARALVRRLHSSAVVTTRPWLPALATGLAALAAGAAGAQVAAPVLKWAHGGCFASWCETGWYASPAVVDLDGDGAPEVVASASSIVLLDGATGALRWRVASGHDRSEPGASNVGRTWPGIVVADIDGDGAPEIATAHGGGWASVYDADGYFEPGWPRRPVAAELRGLTVADLDGDGTMELVVSAARSDPVNTWVLEHDGSTRPGWPQLVGGPGFAWGVYNDNAAVAELDGDPELEIVVPSDITYACSYEPDGTQRVADPVYAGKTWCQVGVWESHATELLGFGLCNGVRAQSYRTSFAHGPATVADLDGDGEWEILFSDFSGRVHAFWLDRTEHGSWPFRVWTAAVGHYRYASEPAVADLDGDGDSEVLFTTWTQKGSNANGSLYIVTSTGELLHQVPLPAGLAATSWNGALAAPTLADLDGDPDLEVVVQTAFSGVVAYDLPGTANARVLWATGRGSARRGGTPGFVCTAEDTETVANETMADETRTVEACEGVTLGPDLYLEEGADLTDRTAGPVEFVPPVQILDGARLTVVNQPPG